MQRSVFAIGLAVLLGLPPGIAPGQAVSAQTGPADDVAAVQPLLPPGISEFNLELYGKLAYTWQLDDGTNVIEVHGNFSARLGLYKLTSRDAVVWFKRRTWNDKTFIDVEIYLWQGAEIIQPGGAVEMGPALLATLRTFGRLLLNVDSHAPHSDEDSALYREADIARQLLVAVPPKEATESEAPVQVAPKLEELIVKRTKVPRKVEFSADQLYFEEYAGESIIVAINDVFVSQGSPAKSGEYAELRADAAVLFVKADQAGDAMPGLLDEGAPEPQPDTGVEFEAVPDQIEPQIEPPVSARPRTTEQRASEWVSAVYLEGDVMLSRGQRMIRASRLYYDFDEDKALILDAVTRAVEPERSIPIYVRAEEIRQLSLSEFLARDAQITTSEFHTPHVAIGAEEVYLEDRTPRNAAGDVIGVQAGTYAAKNTTLNLEGVPVAWWPASRGDFSRDRMAFRSAKTGYNNEFGATLETRWHLLNLLGLEQPAGVDATLKLDYFTDRGPGVGIDVDYEQDEYYGLLRTYYIHDQDEDDLGPIRGGPPDTDDRGRVLWRHRQFLPEDWELTLEASYISDDQFLEAFERNEWENAKDQETLIYLLKRQDNWQFNALFNWRINEFLTQTEHFPDAVLSLIGEPLGEYATWYHESRAGLVRFRPDERRFFNGSERVDNTGRTGTVVRGDIREELQFPLGEFGPVQFTPYVMLRGSSWDDMSADSGHRDRILGSYGIHANTMLSRVYNDVSSELLDLDRLRHVIKIDGTAWNAHANQSPQNLTPFDAGVEDIDDFSGGTIGVRQRFQTKRGKSGAKRTVDWITLDIEAGFFSDAQQGENTHGDFILSRPEDSISSNFIAANMQYRISDSTVLVYDGVYDTNRGNMGNSNLSLAVERAPRFSYFVGWRYIHDTDNNLFAFGGNYKLSEKHTIAFRETYDIEEGRNLSTQFIYIKKWPRWYTAIAFDVDRTLEDVGINFSVWPEGAPRLGVGSKRFTGLTDSVGINLR